MAVENNLENQAGKLSHKQWKKLKRKQKRQQLAAEQQSAQGPPTREQTDEEEEERIEQVIEAENEKQNAIWAEQDRLGHQRWLEKKEREEKEKQKLEETERKIREEWEEREKKEQEEREARDKADADKKDKQVKGNSWLPRRLMIIMGSERPLESVISFKDSLLKKATENEFKEWHNPLAPKTHSTVSNGEITRDVNQCPFFMKTAACRFGDRCSRAHLRPESSTIIKIAGMFSNFELLKSSVDDYDTDFNLEYDDNDLYRSFLDFYHDVVPEFKSVGKLVNVKVCCNHEPHLRGNVYVQYRTEEDAYNAYVKFNARWYAGRQITCEFVNIAKWKLAICGLFFAKRCPKGKNCNFMHVFRNPGNEFWEADRDFENSARGRDSKDMTPRWRNRDDRNSRYSRRSRSRSRSRERSRSTYSRHGRSTRDRSRSPSSRSESRRRSPSERENHRSRRRQGRSSQSPDGRNGSKPRSPNRNSAKRTKQRSRSNSGSPRSHSQSPSASPSKDDVKSEKSRKRNHRSRSHSKADSVLSPPRKRNGLRSQSRSRSRSRSKSAEVRGENVEHKKQKKSKHNKKSKKSSKKKKKSEKVSLDHLAENNQEDSDSERVKDNDCETERREVGNGTCRDSVNGLDGVTGSEVHDVNSDEAASSSSLKQDLQMV